MLPEEVDVVAANGNRYRVVLRPYDANTDARRFSAGWAPIIDRGPEAWLDRDWTWHALTDPKDLAFDIKPEWMVIADEVEPDAMQDILGVLVTSGPVTAQCPGFPQVLLHSAPMLWVEYIAIAPTLRRDCPLVDQRRAQLKGIGVRLMRQAIVRSQASNCGGRIGLHAEGESSKLCYRKWGMKEYPPAPHPAGGSFPVFLGSDTWAADFLVG